VIPQLTDGEWYYLSNSEASGGKGGVGALRFATYGDLIDYEMNLTGTNRSAYNTNAF